MNKCKICKEAGNDFEVNDFHLGFWHGIFKDGKWLKNLINVNVEMKNQ